VLILTAPKYPDPLLQNLLVDSYLPLVEHARRVYGYAGVSVITTLPAVRPSVTSLIPFPTLSSLRGKANPQSEVEKQFTRARWAWIAGAFFGTVAYLWLFSPIRIVLVQPRKLEDEDDGEEEEEEYDEPNDNSTEGGGDEDEGENWTTHG
jgi:hypothetical protein